MSEVISFDVNKRVCVVVDTNVWYSETLLDTPAGLSLVYTLGKQGAVLGLPEVIETEIMKQLVRLGNEAAADYAKAAQTLKHFTGVDAFAAPSADQVEKAVAKKLRDIDRVVERVPITVEHTRAALVMVNAELPPNSHKNQQFKDSLIWQAILTLAKKYSVHFVTADFAFYQDRNKLEKGLAKNLQEESRCVNANIDLHFDLSSCVIALQGQPPSFDQTPLRTFIIEHTLPKLRIEAKRQRCTLGEPWKLKLNVFRTVKADNFAVEFTMTGTWELEQTDLVNRHAKRIAKAYVCCFYKILNGTISVFYVQRVGLLYKSDGGSGSILRSFENDDESNPFHRRIEFLDHWLGDTGFDR